ncbi:MAG TPA: glycine betaine ABC transporter substrate-binding protein [Bacillales bacterium]|nr:glycine betaine ABC transporter substrate-binding protein [Bacillales bacterium]
MKKWFVFLTALALLLSACSNSVSNNKTGDGEAANTNETGSGTEGSHEPIVISGKPWTEQRILPYILADYIKAKTDYPVKVHANVGETNVLHEAITQGSIDMYVEYTGTGYLAVLKKEFKPEQTPQEIYDITKKAYEDNFQLTWLAPLGFENTYSITVRKETKEKYGIEKASDLTKISDQLVFGGPATFFGRPDGYDYMVDSYDYHFKKHVSLKPGLMYKALDAGQVDVIPAFTTDGRIDKLNLVTTEDDHNIFPPYFAAPVVRMDTLKAYPKLDDVVNELKGKISEQEMRKMNAAVDIDHKRPKEVAKQFLQDQGLIK